MVVMDCTVIANPYLGPGSTEAVYDKFNKLRDKCKIIYGVFILLWHNSFFNSSEDIDMNFRLVSL